MVLVPACPSPKGQEVTRPEPGTYTYEVTARAFDPRGRTRVVNSVEGVELTDKVTADGDTYVSEITTAANPDLVTRLRTRWDDQGLLLVSSETETPDGASSCDFEPPVEIVPIPLVEGRLKRQTWESAHCRGTVEVAVKGPETVADTTGRRWRTWAITVRTRTVVTDASTDETETRWFSPELGKDVRTSRIAEGIRSERRFLNETKTLLRSHP